MNRQDTVKAIIWLDQLMAQAKVERQKLAGDLAADARAEFEEQGTAPTWRIPDIATVAASVSHETVTVSDHVRFQRWVAKRYPTEIEEVLVVRPAWLGDFLKRCQTNDLDAVDPDTGEIVPGLTVLPGGSFAGVSIRATGAAKEVFGALANHGLRELATKAGPSVPVVIAELEHA
jgi:hypothetical protein